MNENNSIEDILNVLGGNKNIVVGFSYKDSFVIAVFIFLAIFLAILTANTIKK